MCTNYYMARPTSARPILYKYEGPRRHKCLTIAARQTTSQALVTQAEDKRGQFQSNTYTNRILIACPFIYEPTSRSLLFCRHRCSTMIGSILPFVLFGSTWFGSLGVNVPDGSHGVDLPNGSEFSTFCTSFSSLFTLSSLLSLFSVTT